MSGRVFSLKLLKIKHISKENRLQYFLSIIFIFGIILGCVVYYNSNKASLISSVIFQTLLSKKTDCSFWNLFLFSITNSFLVCIVFFTLGTSLMGTVFIPLLYIVLGGITGGILSYSYENYSVKGIAFNAVIIIPPLLFFVLGLLVVSKKIFEFSILVSKSTFKNNLSAQSNSFDFSIIWKKIGLQIALIICASLLDTVLSSFLIKIFNF